MKKTLSRYCLALALGALVFGAQAQAEDFRVGFVNTDRIFREANSAKQAQAKLEQEFARREKELNDLGTTLKAAEAHNVMVCNVPDYGTTEVADHAMALALSLRRGILLHH